MIINGVAIDDEFAEAFGMKATRILITAQNLTWAHHAAQTATGFATSVIACGCEAGIERELSPAETPDGRPGLAILIFSTSGKELAKQIERRIGQCVLTSPTSAAFAGMEGGEPVALGKNLRFFGDGFQGSKLIDGRRYWRIPVMDGEFLIEETTAVVSGVGGGNFLVLGESQPQVLAACEAAIAAMRKVPNVIMPFPGGIVRSGSKVGSRYKALTASTNDAYCPTIRGITDSALGPDIGSVMEIVIDGLTPADISAAMRAGIQAVTGLGAPGGIRRVTAGNYGGKLGKYHFRLREIMAP
ncbi:MAG TPA: formylmethanofuran--tetrahydromethanopterin N-formyltransferase [Gemmatimonadales bacterium]|jgi:formylmethanofuran--tetrahydromethanopterin N-formyltransferase|nr:formylmethanofuran--tetrahydromethanopterin N-formyltransferase [Gemmatimonadales bacterium]